MIWSSCPQDDKCDSINMDDDPKMTVSIWKMTISIWEMTVSIWKMTASKMGDDRIDMGEDSIDMRDDSIDIGDDSIDMGYLVTLVLNDLPTRRPFWLRCGLLPVTRGLHLSTYQLNVSTFGALLRSSSQSVVSTCLWARLCI
jgi:hypothetical protein